MCIYFVFVCLSILVELVHNSIIHGFVFKIVSIVSVEVFAEFLHQMVVIPGSLNPEFGVLNLVDPVSPSGPFLPRANLLISI